jgi:hypothetical protein
MTSLGISKFTLARSFAGASFVADGPQLVTLVLMDTKQLRQLLQPT